MPGFVYKKLFEVVVIVGAIGGLEEHVDDYSDQEHWQNDC